MKTFNSMPKFISAILIIFVLGLFLMSCHDDDDDAGITVCNLDNHEYDVELRDESDDSLVDEKHVDEWYVPFTNCDTFRNLEEGRYYLVVLNAADVTIDQSDDFHMDAGEYRIFNINSDGDVTGDSAALNESIVSVCNLDADIMRVALKRSSDDSLVTDIDLEHPMIVFDDCIDFDGLEEGSYYIEIESDDSQKTGQSDDFYLAPDENEAFTIDQDGKLVVEESQEQ